MALFGLGHSKDSFSAARNYSLKMLECRRRRKRPVPLLALRDDARLRRDVFREIAPFSLFLR